MHNKEWYTKQAKRHYDAYLVAIDLDDTKAAKYHEREYLNYKELESKA
jgi:hypothetical protein